MAHDQPRPSIRDLIRLSDMARLNPARVDELLDRCGDPSTESRNDNASEPCDDTPA